jgi:hypothetical protein
MDIFMLNEWGGTVVELDTEGSHRFFDMADAA